MKEILAGDSINNAFQILNISPVQTYAGDLYQVWKISDEDFDKLNQISEDDWKDDWGWWRYAEGSNIEHFPTHTFVINHKEMSGYFDDARYDDFVEYEDDIDDIDDWYFTYAALTEYMCNEIGASTETNVCAVAASLAKLNNMKLGELFEKYEGIE